MPKYISKFFRVAVEGDTVDGRKLSGADIEAMGENYSQSVYGARVWVEHLRSLLPDSPFRAYGDIVATKWDTIQEAGPLQGKKALYAQIKPLPELLEMNQKGQKIYSSVEIHPKFSQTGSAYLMGLAVTDSPASVGTEILKFSAEKNQSKHILLSHEEPLELEFEEVQPEKPSLFNRVKDLLSKKSATDDQRFSDVDQAVTEIAGEVVEQEKHFNQALGDKADNSTVAELNTRLEQVTKDFNDLKAQLDKEERPPKVTYRSKATGEVIGDEDEEDFS